MHKNSSKKQRQEKIPLELLGSQEFVKLIKKPPTPLGAVYDFFHLQLGIFNKIIPLLAFRKDNGNYRNRLRYMFFNLAFEPKTQTSILRYWKEMPKFGKIKKERCEIVTSHISNKKIFEDLRLFYTIDLELKNKKEAQVHKFYYSSYDLLAPGIELIDNPFYRFYFVLKPFIKKNYKEELSGNLEQDTCYLYEKITDFWKLFEFFMFIHNQTFYYPDNIMKKYEKAADIIKTIEKDCKKLKFEYITSDSKKNQYYLRKKEILDEWVEKKRIEYQRTILNEIIERGKFVDLRLEKELADYRNTLLKEMEETQRQQLLKELKNYKR